MKTTQSEEQVAARKLAEQKGITVAAAAEMVRQKTAKPTKETTA